MAEITASMVKELREKTGAGMMDAKSALVENKGDMEASVDWLRKKGLAKAAKKSGRTAAEGLVAIATEGTKGAVVEVNSETDFVARNEEFQALAKKAAQVALKAKDAANIAGENMDGKTVQDTLTALIAKIGENMSLRRSARLEVSKGVVAGYIHSALSPGLGKIGVLVALESEGKKEVLEDVGRKIAMHTAAASPECLAVENIDPEKLAREKAVLAEKHKASGKPADKIDQIVEGDLRKNFYGQICLLEQTFIMDGQTKISKVLEAASRDAGAPVKIAGFVRFQLGEGIEVEKEDFAAEVAKAANG
ncbi:MAG: elongation factor Ts [Alphaproteobacteria bacterium]|nr:elongation factor Ts [Alphaproteobacteria bacterium]